MADDSQKILKELSSLSSNLDVLSRELRQNNKLLSDQKQVQTKILEDKADEKTEEKGDAKQPLDQKFFENFSKSLADNFQKGQGNLTSSITQTLGKELSGILQKKENKPAQIKPLPADDKETNPINFLLNSLKSLPKMQDGGKVTSSGTAIVGEKGPEVVNLVQGSKVSPTKNPTSTPKKPVDPEKKKLKEEEELRMFLASMSENDMERKMAYTLGNLDIVNSVKKENFVGNSTDNSSASLENSPKLEAVVNGSKNASQTSSISSSTGQNTKAQSQLSAVESSIQKNGPPPIKDVGKFKNFKNVWGIQVPMDVLNEYRNKLYKEDPDYYTEFDDLDSDTLSHFKYNRNYPEYLPAYMKPDEIEETLKKGIEDDPELMTPQDVAKLATPVKTPPLDPNVDMQSPSSSSSKKREKKGAKETVEDELEKKKKEGKKFSETKFGKSIIDSAQLLGMGSMAKFTKFTAGKEEETLDNRQKTFGSSEVSNEQQQLKVMERAKDQSKEVQLGSNPQQVQKIQGTNTASSETKPIATSSLPPSQTQSLSKSNGNQEPMDLTKDMKELKGLLAGIYKSLQSHLDISTNSPYRPNSNII